MSNELDTPKEQANPSPTACYSASGIGQHLSQLKVYVTPEVDGELVECEIVKAEIERIEERAERLWNALAATERELAYQQETSRRHRFLGLVNTFKELRSKLMLRMSE